MAGFNKTGKIAFSVNFGMRFVDKIQGGNLTNLNGLLQYKVVIM